MSTRVLRQGSARFEASQPSELAEALADAEEVEAERDDRGRRREDAEVPDAREAAANLAGKLEAMQTQITELLQVISERAAPAVTQEPEAKPAAKTK